MLPSEDRDENIPTLLPLTVLPPSYKGPWITMDLRIIFPDPQPYLNHTCKIPFAMKGNIHKVGRHSSVDHREKGENTHFHLLVLT